MKTWSKYNIFSKIKNSENYYLINLLTQSADVVNPETADLIKNEKYDEIEDFSEKGYLVDPIEEKKLFNTSYLDFIETRDNEEIQLLFVPWYNCNFSCSYCYQDEYSTENIVLNEVIIDAFFDYVSKKFAGRGKYLTIFGGEPLLNSEKSKKSIKYLLEQAEVHNLPVAIVTNGYHLNEYLDLFKQFKLREIQVTLDGPAKIHNERRKFKSTNGSTFNEIIKGVDGALKNNIPINLRVVVDRKNFDSLIDLARFAIDKGWTKNKLFKTQLGRNYELHHCSSNPQHLYSRIELYEELYELINKNPEFVEFHSPSFSISKFLFENGELPPPLFDSCPGCKSEWAFDYTGKIFSCTATVGKNGEELGSFYPKVSLDEELVEKWEDRDITIIDECKNCNLALACGGGCASIAFNRTKNLHSPDCRPVKELLELGFSYYFEKR